MAFYYILEGFVVFVVALYIITQVILAPAMGKKFFWIHNRKEKTLNAKEDELIEVKTEEKLADADKVIAEAKANVAEKLKAPARKPRRKVEKSDGNNT